ncbi:MAG TPA: metal-dependent transcriptional regulator [Proteiniclasticum sp.]|nr:metal-dependent transcriptional regulator [Proteiniclasticum sp.]
MKLTESIEMYLATIMLLEEEHGSAKVVEIAEILGVTKPSVSKAMSQLLEDGYIDKELYGHITLTEKGRQAADKVVRKRRLIISYLQHSLGLSKEEASKNACRMEHVISDEMLEGIRTYLGEHEKKAQ